MKLAKLYVDATPKSIAYVVDAGNTYYECHTIEKHTTNEAEYMALIEGLEYCIIEGYDLLQIFSDSEIVVKQILGHYKVRNNLIPFHRKATELIAHFGIGTSITHIPGTENPADYFSREGCKHEKE